MADVVRGMAEMKWRDENWTIVEVLACQLHAMGWIRNGRVRSTLVRCERTISVFLEISQLLGR